MRTRTVFLSALVITASALAAPTLAATLDVPADYPTIAAALAVAVATDEVVVAAGTYLEHDLILPSGVVLRGATGDRADVIIDAQRAGRCVYGAALDATTRLAALTLANGLPAWGTTPHNSWGAGLMVDGGSLTVANCLFTGNETAVGGGAFVIGTGTPAFIDCVFDGNSATESCGLVLHGTCDPLVQGCVFRNGNRCLVGGGLTWSGSGHALIDGCTVEDNSVWETGGGVEVFGSGAVATLRDCAIRRNSARLGAGGLSVGNYGRAILERGEIVANSAGSYAGGVDVGYGAVLEASGTTILNNSAPTGPDGDIGSSAAATLTCCHIDLSAWHVLGSLIVADDGCGVAVDSASWGQVKAMFR